MFGVKIQHWERFCTSFLELQRSGFYRKYKFVITFILVSRRKEVNCIEHVLKYKRLRNIILEKKYLQEIEYKLPWEKSCIYIRVN